MPTKPARRHSVPWLLLCALMLTACAARLPTPALPQTPPPPAALMSEQPVQDWHAFSAKLQTWLQSARRAVEMLPAR